MKVALLSRTIASGLVAGVLLGAVDRATADGPVAPPPPVVLGSILGNLNGLNDFGTIVAIGNLASVLLVDGSPVVQASGSAAQMGALASISYFVSLSGPAFDMNGDVVRVPILVSGSVQAFAPLGYSATAFIDFGDGLQVHSGAGSPGLQTLTGTISELVSPGGFAIGMGATVAGSSALAPASAAQAMADPTIMIDPTFANASLYSLQLSPGFVASPVPEPSVFAMFAFGISILGTMRFVRRVKSSIG